MQSQKAADSLFTIRLTDRSTYPHAGKLVAIDRAVNRQTGSLTIRLSFPNPERQLISGMTVNVNVLNQDIGEQVVVPYRAVVEQMGEFFVYVIQGDSVQQRNLQLGSRISDQVVVRDGLKAGENIVVEGMQRLREGAKVQVSTGQAAPAQPAAAR